MKRQIRSAATAALVALGTLAALLTVASPAQADVEICDQYGTTTIQGQYVVQNNRWGTEQTQCINVTDNGFTVTQADGSVATNGAPKSYPSVYLGCHYTNCSPGTNLPLQVNSISDAPSSISYGYNTSGAVYNASYDIWLDPTPRTDGVSQTEIMIWFSRVGPVQPIGSPVGTANVGGRSWEVWTGSNGSNDVISFLAPSTINSWNFDVKDFIDEAVGRGMAQPDWYLTSIQAGFEPWENGAGLSVDSFSADVNEGQDSGDESGTDESGTDESGTDESGTDESGTDESGSDESGTGGDSCQVAYATNSWGTGFTADVTITNTGSSAVNGWDLDFTLPGGQSITNSWNANLSGTSGSVTAGNVDFNGQIAPNGGTASFGFQGSYSGSFDTPSDFTLNGTSCGTA